MQTSLLDVGLGWGREMLWFMTRFDFTEYLGSLCTMYVYSPDTTILLLNSSPCHVMAVHYVEKGNSLIDPG